MVANRAHECHDSSERRPRVCSPLGNCSFFAARLRPGLTWDGMGLRRCYPVFFSSSKTLSPSPCVAAVVLVAPSHILSATAIYCLSGNPRQRQPPALSPPARLGPFSRATAPPPSLPPSFSPFIPLLCSFLLSLSHRRRRRQTHCSAAAALALALLPLSLTLKSRMAAMAAAAAAPNPLLFSLFHFSMRQTGIAIRDKSPSLRPWYPPPALKRLMFRLA